MLTDETTALAKIFDIEVRGTVGRISAQRFKSSEVDDGVFRWIDCGEDRGSHRNTDARKTTQHSNFGAIGLCAYRKAKDISDFLIGVPSKTNSAPSFGLPLEDRREVGAGEFTIGNALPGSKGRRRLGDWSAGRGEEIGVRVELLPQKTGTAEIVARKSRRSSEDCFIMFRLPRTR